MSCILEGLWGHVREHVGEIDDSMLQLRRDLEGELEVLNNKEGAKVRRFLKLLKIAETALDEAYKKIVCPETGPAVPDWMEGMMKKAERVSREMKRKGII